MYVSMYVCMYVCMLYDVHVYITGKRGRKEILPGGAELIKCIDPNEGEALRGPPSNLGAGAPCPPDPPPIYGGRQGGGRQGGDRLIISWYTIIMA